MSNGRAIVAEYSHGDGFRLRRVLPRSSRLRLVIDSMCQNKRKALTSCGDIQKEYNIRMMVVLTPPGSRFVSVPGVMAIHDNSQDSSQR